MNYVPEPCGVSNLDRKLAWLGHTIFEALIDWLIDFFVTSNTKINSCYIKSNINKKINIQIFFALQ